MRAIQSFAINRPVATTMFYLAVCLLGFLSFQRLEVSLLPRVEYPRLVVITRYPDAAPEEVENLVTRPLAEQVRTVGAVRKIFSESLEGVSVITLEFAWTAGLDRAAIETRDRLDLARGRLPEDVEKSIISRFDPSEEPFMELVVFARDMARPRELRGFTERNLKAYLDRIEGVALVELSGGETREIQLDVDHARLVAHGLTLPGVGEALRATNVSLPAGSIAAGDKDVLIRTVGRFNRPEEIAGAVVGWGANGTVIRFGQIGTVTAGYREQTGLARYNGRDAVLVALKRESGHNIVATARALRAEVELLQERFSREVEIRIVYDRARYTEAATNNIIQSLIVGGILAFLALLFILRNLHSPLILVSVVPVALLFTFIPMGLFGLSLNVMSLGGLALGVGMLFDSGNVVLAAIERHRRAGHSPGEAAGRGGAEVTGSVTVAVLTTVIVFLPVIFLESVIGVVFREMALTITFALLATIPAALTLIPMLAARDWPGASLELERYGPFRVAARLEERLETGYARSLRSLLARRALPVRWLILAGLPALLLVYFLEFEFVPPVDAGELTMDVELLRGTPLEGTVRQVSRIETVLAEKSNVAHVIVRAGSGPDQVERGGESGTHRARVRVLLEEGASGRELVTSVRPRLEADIDGRVRFEPTGDVIGQLLATESSMVAIDVAGEDVAVLGEIGDQIAGKLRGVPGLSDVVTGLGERGREIHVIPDEARLAVYGVSNEYLARYLGTALRGEVVTTLRAGDEEIDVRLRAREADRAGLERVRSFEIRSEAGRDFLFSQMGIFKDTAGYTAIQRTGGARVNRVSARTDRPAFQEIDAIIATARASLPPGYQVTLAGERESMLGAFQELLFALGLAALLIYMLLAAQFESYRIAAVLMLTVPMIAAGIVPALVLTGKSFNVSSFTGVILLVGIVVDNAALLYEYAAKLRAEGLPVAVALENAGRIVLRPVLMNTGTTAVALIPAALEIGQGTEFQAPMAITLISGLAAAVVLTLFVIPVVLSWMLEPGR